MALDILLIDGFDKYGDTAELNDAWGRTSSSYDLVLDTGDSPFAEGQSIEYPDSNSVPSLSSEAMNIRPLSLGLSTSGVTQLGMFVCFRFRLHGNSALDTAFTVSGDYNTNANSNSSVSANSSLGSFSLLGASASLKDTITGLSFADGGWHSFEWYWFWSDNSTGAGYVYYDGELVLSASGYDSQYSSFGNPGYLAFFLGAEGWKMDDLVFGTSSDPANDRLGSGGAWQVPIIPVASDAGTNEWTPSSGTDHYAMVDEFPSDEGTTYLESSAAGQAEEFGLATMSSTVQEVLALEVSGSFAGSAAGLSRAAEMYVDSNGTEEILAGPFTLTGTSYSERAGTILSNDPDTGVAWTKAGAQALTLGFRT